MSVMIQFEMKTAGNDFMNAMQKAFGEYDDAKAWRLTDSEIPILHGMAAMVRVTPNLYEGLIEIITKYHRVNVLCEWEGGKINECHGQI